MKNFYRILPWILILVFSISFLPVTNAAAAEHESLTLSGVWQINSGWEQAYEDGRLSAFDFDCFAHVIIDGVQIPIDCIYFDPEESVSSLFATPFNSDYLVAFHSDGSSTTDDGLIYFDESVTISGDAAAFFLEYAQETVAPDCVVLSGVWQIKSGWEQAAVDDRLSAFDFDCFAHVIIDGVQIPIDCIYFDPQESASSLFVSPLNSADIAAFDSDGSSTTDDGRIYFDESVIISGDAAAFFSEYASFFDISSLKTATFVIGGKSFVFTGSHTSLPEVTITVSAGGVLLSDGVTSYFYEHGSSVLGYKLQPDADSYIGIGESFVFSSDFSFSSYAVVLYPFTLTEATYTTTIYLYNESGGILKQLIYSAVGSSPSVSMFVFDHAVNFDCVGKIESQAVLGRKVLGLSHTLSGSATYFPNSEYTLNGKTGEDVVYYLYLTTSLSGSDPDDGSGTGSIVSAVMSGFVSALLEPVMAFFSVEFIPGFSFGKIALVAFLIGLVFWFLKISKS